MLASVHEPKLSASEKVLLSGLKQMRQANEALWRENLELRQKIEALERWKFGIEQAEALVEIGIPKDG